MAKSNEISKSLSSIRGIKKEAKELIKQVDVLEKGISKGNLTPDGTTVVKLSSKHAKLIKYKKQIAAETIRLKRKK